MKCIIRPMIGFENVRCARLPLPGIEMYLIRKAKLKDDDGAGTVVGQSDSFAI